MTAAYGTGFPGDRESVLIRPQCDGPLKAGAMVLCRREEDGRRVCWVVWGCSRRHVWWKSTAPLDVCPYPDLVEK